MPSNNILALIIGLLAIAGAVAYRLLSARPEKPPEEQKKAQVPPAKQEPKVVIKRVTKEKKIFRTPPALLAVIVIAIIVAVRYYGGQLQTSAMRVPDGMTIHHQYVKPAWDWFGVSTIFWLLIGWSALYKLCEWWQRR